MNTCHALLFAALGCVVSAEALSRPVSYAGGWTLIGESDRQSSSALLHYTPTYQWSLGPRLEVNRDNHFALTTLHATRLAKRWCAPSSDRVRVLVHRRGGYRLADTLSKRESTSAEPRVSPIWWL